MAVQHLQVARTAAAFRAQWRSGLPVLGDATVTLRELRIADAQSLLANLNDEAVWRYIERCPPTAAGFRRFIRWTRAERSSGRLFCFGIVPRGSAVAVGVLQIWPVERDFSTAEWGFVLGARYWGTGVFASGARLLLDAAFSQLGVYRLEARSVDINFRGNAVLEKLGARAEGVLRGAFRDGAEMRSHVMWSILAPEWARRQLARREH